MHQDDRCRTRVSRRQVLLIRKDEQGKCMFGRIHSIVSKEFASPENLHFILKLYDTIGLEVHFWSYLVQESVR